MAAIPAGACIAQHLSGHHGQAEGVVQLTVGEQAAIGGDPGAVELELQTAVERDPQGLFRFNRRVRHSWFAPPAPWL